MDDVKPEDVFDKARRLYPGIRRGNTTEFANFTKKHKDWKEVLPLLYPAIQNQIKWRETAKANGLRFIRCWKMFQTWINQRCWEEEPDEEITKIMNKKSIFAKNNNGSYIAYAVKCVRHQDSDKIGHGYNIRLPIGMTDLESHAMKEKLRQESEVGGDWEIIWPSEFI